VQCTFIETKLRRSIVRVAKIPMRKLRMLKIGIG